MINGWGVLSKWLWCASLMIGAWFGNGCGAFGNGWGVRSCVFFRFCLFLYIHSPFSRIRYMSVFRLYSFFLSPLPCFFIHCSASSPTCGTCHFCQNFLSSLEVKWVFRLAALQANLSCGSSGRLVIHSCELDGLLGFISWTSNNDMEPGL